MFRHATFAAAVALLLSACGSYRGMPRYQSAGEYHGAFSSNGSNSQDGQYPSSTWQSSSFSASRSYIPRGEFVLYWPLTRIHINRGFHPARDPDHQGLDLGGYTGTPILAAHEGHVVYAGHGFHGYGNMVLLEYNKEWATLYAHMQHIVVREGAILKPGDPIGTMGRTGHATGVHLHFELMHNRQPVDPLKYLPSRFPEKGVMSSRNERTRTRR